MQSCKILQPVANHPQLKEALLCSDHRPVFLAAAKEDQTSEAAEAAAKAAKKAADQSKKFLYDLAAGGTAGGISKTVVAPIERVKLLLQTQHSNPRIKSGEIAPYTGQPLLLCFELKVRAAT